MNAIVNALYIIWRRMRDGARRSQPAIEILTAIALVWFAYLTARTDERIAGIQEAQRAILEAQNAPIFTGRAQYADAADEPGDSGAPAASGAPDRTGPRERITLGNAGAQIRPVRVCHLDLMRLEWLTGEPAWVHSSPVRLRLVQYHRVAPETRLTPAEHDRPPIVDVPAFKTVRRGGLAPGQIYDSTLAVDFDAAARALFAEPAVGAMLLAQVRWFRNSDNTPFTAPVTGRVVTTGYDIEHYVAVVYADGLNRRSAALVQVDGEGAQVLPWGEAWTLMQAVGFDYDPSLPVRAGINPAPRNAFWQGLFDEPGAVFFCASRDTRGTSGVFNVTRQRGR
jgi:hypothetical protein